jgi:hypothetical protein
MNVHMILLIILTLNIYHLNGRKHRRINTYDNTIELSSLVDQTTTLTCLINLKNRNFSLSFNYQVCNH